jgi:hypothetical protein
MIPFADDDVVSLTLAIMTVSGYNLWPAILRVILTIESKLLGGENRKGKEIDFILVLFTYLLFLFFFPSCSSCSSPYPTKTLT